MESNSTAEAPPPLPSAAAGPPPIEARREKTETPPPIPGSQSQLQSQSPPPVPAPRQPSPPPVPKMPPALRKVIERQPKQVRGFFRGALRFFRRVVGLISTVFALAILSSIPILNFLSFGYMLEASGRIARTGKFRAGFIGNKKLAVLGITVIVGWVAFFPARLISSLWKDAQLIDPTSTPTTFTWVALVAMALLALAVTFTTFVLLSWSVLGNGSRGGLYVFVRDTVLDFVESLRLPYYFWLGLRGFAGALLWLVIPVGILLLAANATLPGPAALLGILGSLLLIPVILWLPFIEAHFARTGEFRAFKQLGVVRKAFTRAPVAFWLALFVTLLFAVPLYLFKIEMPPDELAWFFALFFVIFILPARMIAGWAMSRAFKSETKRFWLSRWGMRIAAVPIALAYVVWIFIMQYFQWSGEVSLLLEQHAFLLPAPLLEW